MQQEAEDFTLSLSWLPGSAAAQNTRSERTSPSGRVQVAQREQGKRHSGILRDRELREMRTPGEKDEFWCWFHWIIIQQTSVSYLETGPKCEIIHSLGGKDVVSNSLCEHTGAVIFHNRVQHGSFLSGWNLQRIQDDFLECHFYLHHHQCKFPKGMATGDNPKVQSLAWRALCPTQLQINTFPQL